MSGKTAHKQRNGEEANQENHSAEEAVQATQESLDKVRDILFGTQLKDQDRRFSSLEEKFADDFAHFRDETRKSVQSLETFVKSELAALGARIASESKQRDEAFGMISEECRSTSQRVEKRVGEFDQQHAGAEADIRKALHEQANAARDELKAVHAELHALVEKLVTDLKSAKTDRAALAGLFNEMAGRLQG